MGTGRGLPGGQTRRRAGASMFYWRSRRLEIHGAYW